MITEQFLQFQAKPEFQTMFSEILTTRNERLQIDTVVKRSKDRNCNHSKNQLQILTKIQGCQGFPRVLSFQLNEQCKVKQIQLQKLGTSLRRLMSNSLSMNVKIPISVVIKLGLEMLERVQALHSFGFIHQDLKPEHFLFQTTNFNSTLYLIDFGLSSRIQQENDQDNQHNLQRISFRGNIAYASVNKMKCLKPKIQDDLQSLLYIIVELLEGQLPWRSYNANDVQKANFNTLYHQTLRKKLKKSMWKNYGEWINCTLKKIRQNSNPYDEFRKSIFKLIQLEI